MSRSTVPLALPAPAAVLAAALSALLALAVVGVAVPLGAEAAPPARSAATDAVAVIQADHDATRASAGLPRLVRDAAMNAVAQAWAQQMADRSNSVGAAALVHSSTDTSGRYDYATHLPAGWSRAAENIGYASGDDPAGLYAAWLASPPHRATIYTAAYDRVGYGVASSASGALYAAVEFADYPSTGATAAASSAAPSSSARSTGSSGGGAAGGTGGGAASAAPGRSTGAASTGSRATGSAAPLPSGVRATTAASSSATASTRSTASTTVAPGRSAAAPATGATSRTAADSTPTSATTTPSTATRRPAVQAVTGADRYETAVALARATARAPARVVLASGERGAEVDAQVAAPLAHALGAPVLLTGRDGLPPAVVAYLQDTPSIAGVVLVGGTAVISDDVVALLTARDLTVDRVGGRDRTATSALVAARPELAASRTALVVAGTGALADAISASGAAAAASAPLVLVPRAARSLPAVMRTALVGRTAVLVGGSDALPEVLVRALAATGTEASGTGVAATATTGAAGTAPTRVAGADRYATSLALARWTLGRGATSGVVVAAGTTDRLPDALAAGSLGRPTILVPVSGWGEARSVLTDGLRARESTIALGAGTPVA